MFLTLRTIFFRNTYLQPLHLADDLFLFFVFDDFELSLFIPRDTSIGSLYTFKSHYVHCKVCPRCVRALSDELSMMYYDPRTSEYVLLLQKDMRVFCLGSQYSVALAQGRVFARAEWRLPGRGARRMRDAVRFLSRRAARGLVVDATHARHFALQIYDQNESREKHLFVCL